MSRRGWALFGAVSVLWGVPYLFISLALEGLGAVSVVAVRVLLGALVLLPLTLRRGLPRTLRAHLPRLAVLALVEVVAPFTLIAVGELSVSSGLTGVLIATEPLFVLLIGLVWKGSDRITSGAWAGVAAGFLGVITLFGVGGGGPGMPLIIAAAACYGLGALLVRRWFAGVPGIVVTTAMLLLATPPLLALAAVTDPAPQLTTQVLIAVLVLGVVCTAGGFTAFFALISAAGPVRASFITYVAPLVAVAAGVLVQGEPVTFRMVAGTVLVLLGASLAVRTPAPPAPDTHGPQPAIGSEPGREARA
ncbi:DMT family transporter [Nonomuraea sp. NPDC050153]|uniref:DMT family transporter n=1 Tax=Nonomuraea sp. NPDC050153 TaxID=3364359 RepID=UPI0037B5CDEB